MFDRPLPFALSSLCLWSIQAELQFELCFNYEIEFSSLTRCFQVRNLVFKSENWIPSQKWCSKSEIECPCMAVHIQIGKFTFKSEICPSNINLGSQSLHLASTDEINWKSLKFGAKSDLFVSERKKTAFAPPLAYIYQKLFFLLDFSFFPGSKSDTKVIQKWYKSDTKVIQKWYTAYVTKT